MPHLCADLSLIGLVPRGYAVHPKKRLSGSLSFPSHL